ncbi:MAG: hypothetical protein WAM60_25180, partial [Candidatus Promineifilaceae bacterium]
MPDHLTSTEKSAAVSIPITKEIVDLSLEIEQFPNEAASAFPPLTHEHLDELANYAMEASLEFPRRGWEIMADAHNRAKLTQDVLLSAKAAWYLGRAANEYGRPRLAAEALARAEQQFTNLNDPEWLAAVTWQRYALCWANADNALAVQSLQQALTTLKNTATTHPLHAYIPQCRLTLTYAKLLKGDHEDLPLLLQKCTADFTAANDLPNQSRTLFVQSGLLRRTAPYSEAKAASQQGMALAQAAHSAADIGRFHCQIGYNNWLGDGDYEAAAKSFQAGITLFDTLDIPGWKAQCQEGLVHIYIMTGRLADAGHLLETARINYQEEEAIGMYHASLLTTGWLEMLRGNYLTSLNYLNLSKAAYQNAGNDKMVPVVEMHLGDTCLQLGRFQQALQYLEQAYSKLEQFNQPNRLAECGLRLANLWTRLDKSKQAKRYLDKVKKNALESGHVSALQAYYFRLADLYNKQSETEKALDALTNALHLAQEQKNPKMEAACHRQIAAAYCQQKQLDKATEQLTLAQSSIREMGLRHEHVACLLIWGDIYRQQGLLKKARKALQEADRFSRKLLPDLNWQAAAALAELAEETNNKEKALNHYRQMIQSLRLLRQGFWQPELVGGYLKRPSASLNRAVLLCAQRGSHQDTLVFIEENKAQTTARRIQAQALFREFDLMPKQAKDMVAEIRWLQENLRTADAPSSPAIMRSAEEDNKYFRLRDKIDAYIELLDRLQREQIEDSEIPINDSFKLEQFRLLANKNLGSDWIALDYYQVGDQLVRLLLTPDQVT